MQYKDQTLHEMRKLPGVADLPVAVAASFIKALRAEGAGDHTTAAEYLNAAVDKEEQLHA